MFNLFTLLENGTIEILNMREQSKTKQKICGTKVCEDEEVRKYFISPKVENEVFD